MADTSGFVSLAQSGAQRNDEEWNRFLDAIGKYKERKERGDVREQAQSNWREDRDAADFKIDADLGIANRGLDLQEAIYGETVDQNAITNALNQAKQELTEAEHLSDVKYKGNLMLIELLRLEQAGELAGLDNDAAMARLNLELDRQDGIDKDAPPPMDSIFYGLLVEGEKLFGENPWENQENHTRLREIFDGALPSLQVEYGLEDTEVDILKDRFENYLAGEEETPVIINPVDGVTGENPVESAVVSSAGVSTLGGGASDYRANQAFQSGLERERRIEGAEGSGEGYKSVWAGSVDAGLEKGSLYSEEDWVTDLAKMNNLLKLFPSDVSPEIKSQVNEQISSISTKSGLRSARVGKNEMVETIELLGELLDSISQAGGQ